MKHLYLTNAPYQLSTDPALLQLSTIHQYLSEEAYWCRGIPFERVQKAADNSLNFGIYLDEQQIAYARVVTDYSTVAYLGDVFVLPAYRGRGLSKWLVESIMEHTELQGLRRWILLTGDAHGLYQQYGWESIAHPERWMEVYDKEVYNTL